MISYYIVMVLPVVCLDVVCLLLLSSAERDVGTVIKGALTCTQTCQRHDINVLAVLRIYRSSRRSLAVNRRHGI